MPYDLDRHIGLSQRLLDAETASGGLLEYCRFTMPDAADNTDAPTPRTKYKTGRHHELIARTLEAVEAGLLRRVIIKAPPRHGKTELATKKFIPWYSGRHPDHHIIFGTYNSTYAEDNGRAIRGTLQSLEHRLAFPGHALKAGSEAADRLETLEGAQLNFVGRGGAATGRGGHGIIIDDPIKDRKEADSKLIRDTLWTWFTQVIATRLMESWGWIVLIQTQWHEDDLIGRLTDPFNPYYDPEEAKLWTVIDLPALALDRDQLGRAEGEALWPERFPASFLEEQRRRDPRGFSALYQGRPSSDGGNLFTADMLQTYKPDQLPKNLRYYVASDHAVATSQANDRSAFVVVGVDDHQNIWVLPDTIHTRLAADRAVEEMLRIMRTRQPTFWWAERGAITKSLGPFLRKRMQEEGVYTPILELTPAADKQTRAGSILGRAGMRKVFFPDYASWWPEARDQLLKFPYGAHDDFVDALAYIGLGLGSIAGASQLVARTNTPKAGTYRALFAQTRAADRARQRARQNNGW